MSSSVALFDTKIEFGGGDARDQQVAQRVLLKPFNNSPLPTTHDIDANIRIEKVRHLEAFALLRCFGLLASIREEVALKLVQAAEHELPRVVVRYEHNSVSYPFYIDLLALETKRLR